MKPEVHFMCCFCGQECPGDCQLALIQDVGSEDQQEQFWFCHFGCFERAVVKKARVFADEDDELDWENAKICTCPRDEKKSITMRLSDCPIHGKEA